MNSRRLFVLFVALSKHFQFRFTVYEQPAQAFPEGPLVEYDSWEDRHLADTAHVLHSYAASLLMPTRSTFTARAP